MGRKKKVETVSQQQENIKEFKINSTTPIAYQGTVQIKIKKNNRIISNTIKRNRGSDQMFKYLAYCLNGELKQNLAPSYILLANKSINTNATISYTILSNVIECSGTVLNGNIVSKQFLIPYSAISSDSTEITTINTLILTNYDSKSAFNSGISLSETTINTYSSAIIDLTENDEIDLSNLGTDNAILIVWDMQIKDISSNSNNGGNN